MFDRKWIYELLSPENAGLVLIDYEPQMVFGVEYENFGVVKTCIRRRVYE